MKNPAHFVVPLWALFFRNLL